MPYASFRTGSPLQYQPYHHAFMRSTSNADNVVKSIEPTIQILKQQILNSRLSNSTN